MGSVGQRIAVDAMGGDFAPNEIVAGAVRACDELGLDIALVGHPQRLETCLNHWGGPRRGLEIVPADEMVEMDEEPLMALRRKPKASINVAMDLVKTGQAAAVVSAGHSGAAMAAALLRLGRIRGIDRPAIGGVFPTLNGDKPVLILDVGANVDCRPKYLEQFAVMGAIYSEYVLGTPQPKVGLLNIGEEEGKGNDLAIQAYERLKENPHLHFIGNAEGRDVLSGQFDVVVCDGFVGNVVLKFAEAVGSMLLHIVKEELIRGPRGKVGAALLKPNLKRIKQRIDYAEHGGGLLLGVNGVCIIAHGSSKAVSAFSAIRLAHEAIDGRAIERIQSQYQQTLQSPPGELTSIES